MQIGVLAPPCQAALLRSEREHPFPMGKGDTPYSGAGVWSWGPGVREYSASVRVKNCPWLWAVFEESWQSVPFAPLGHCPWHLMLWWQEFCPQTASGLVTWRRAEWLLRAAAGVLDGLALELALPFVSCVTLDVTSLCLTPLTYKMERMRGSASAGL